MSELYPYQYRELHNTSLLKIKTSGAVIHTFQTSGPILTSQPVRPVKP